MYWGGAGFPKKRVFRSMVFTRPWVIWRLPPISLVNLHRVGAKNEFIIFRKNFILHFQKFKNPKF